jgi:hypothetical protein
LCMTPSKVRNVVMVSRMHSLRAAVATSAGQPWAGLR